MGQWPLKSIINDICHRVQRIKNLNVQGLTPPVLNGGSYLMEPRAVLNQIVTRIDRDISARFFKLFRINLSFKNNPLKHRFYNVIILMNLTNIKQSKSNK